MKELDDFTVERLQAIAEQNALVFPPSHAEAAALARIALAAKTAKESHSRREVWDGGNTWVQCSKQAYDRHEAAGNRVRVLYEKVVLPNSPELPDGWIPCALRMPEVGGLVLIYTRHIEMIVASLDADGFFATSEGTCYHPDSVVLWQPAPTPPTTKR